MEKARDVASPKDLQWDLALIEFHLRQGRAPAALEAAKLATAKVPDDLPALLALSRAQLATGDAIAAKSSLNNATRFAAFDARTQVKIAGLQIAAGNLPGAARRGVQPGEGAVRPTRLCARPGNDGRGGDAPG